MTITASITPAASAAVDRINATSRRVQQPQSSADLVSLAMGEPNFDTPDVVLDAARASLAAGRTHYSPLRGEEALRSAIAKSLSTKHNLEDRPEDVLVTHGGTAGIAAAMIGLLNPGDRVIVPDPTYSLYADLASMVGAELVPVPLLPNLHWDIPAMQKALVGARMLVFCNPSNPTGIVHDRTELGQITAALRGTDTIVLADEAYSDLVFTPDGFTSVLDVPELAERALYCQTFSKSYAMTGWRVGYLWGPGPLIDSAARIAATLNGSVNTVVQDAAVAALHHGAADVSRMREAYLSRQALLTDALRNAPELTLSSPEGAFYLFPRYDFDLPSTQVVARLRQLGVAVRPGSEFGNAGEHHLRLSYAASEEALAIGARRLVSGLATLRSEATA